VISCFNLNVYERKGKKRLPYFKISLFLILFLCQTARSATYYVAITGSNSNPGSQQLPWLTIQYAANSVSGGDTVIVFSGAYNERVHLNNPGTPGHKIVYWQNQPELFICKGSW